MSRGIKNTVFHFFGSFGIFNITGMNKSIWAYDVNKFDYIKNIFFSFSLSSYHKNQLTYLWFEFMKEYQRKSNNHDVIASKAIRKRRFFLSLYMYIWYSKTMHECSRNIKIYSPSRIKLSLSDAFDNMLFLGGINLYFFHHNNAQNI